MTTTVTESENLSLCARCLCAKSVREFRRRRKDDPRRQRTCRACHAETERQRRAACREQRDQTTIRQFVLDVRAADTSQHIGLLVAKVEQELGGAQRLADEWVRHFRVACRKNGGKRVLDFFAAVMRLSVACSELRPKPVFDAMNDAEFLEAKNRLLADYLLENLPAILQTLSSQGWTISPPAESNGRV